MERIFVSSTWSQMQRFRTKVLEGLDRLRLTGYELEWYGMEAFAASPHESSREVILRHLSQCTTYVGVLGPRYGSVSERDGVSFVELEYEAAVALDMPRLLFLMDAGCSAWNDIGEDSDHRVRSAQQTLRSRFESDRQLNYFDSPGDLALKVVVSLIPSLNVERDELIDLILNQVIPGRGQNEPDNVAMTASPALVKANGTTSATITATFTDADGDIVPDGTEVAFLVAGNGICNPRFAQTIDGVATTTLSIRGSAFDGKCYVECVAIRNEVSGLIYVDYEGVREP